MSGYEFIEDLIDQYVIAVQKCKDMEATDIFHELLAKYANIVTRNYADTLINDEAGKKIIDAFNSEVQEIIDKNPAFKAKAEAYLEQQFRDKYKL